MGNSTHYHGSQRSEIFNDFVGIPWVLGGNTKSGADCWGLVSLVSDMVYGVKIKEHIGSCESGSVLNAIITDEMRSNRWVMQHGPAFGNVAVMFDKMSDRPMHVGITIDENYILHSPDHSNKSGSQIHKIKLLNRVFSRIEYYKYDNCIS